MRGDVSEGYKFDPTSIGKQAKVLEYNCDSRSDWCVHCISNIILIKKYIK